MIYEKGFVPVDDVPQIRKELMRERNARYKKLKNKDVDDDDE